MEFIDLAPMRYQKHAHGLCVWRNRFIICVGSWHGPGLRTCEMYDTQDDVLWELPELKEGICAQGLVTIKDRLQKLGGTSDIGFIEMLVLHQSKG